MAVKPITPGEAEIQAVVRFPDVVIESFNEVIAKHYSNGRSTFTKKEVVSVILENWCQAHFQELDPKDLYANKWLDVEPVYRAQGWIVEYDQPGYNETYEATFTFKKN